MQFSSTGLKNITEYLEYYHDEKHVVLDLSGPNQSVLEFFARFNCRLLVANAKQSMALSRIGENSETTESDENDSGNRIDYAKIFQNVLSTQKPADLSVVMAWDYFNYMESYEIISLMKFLSPYCRPGAKLYTISWLTETIPGYPSEFDLTNEGEVISELSTSEVISSPEYSAQTIVEMMPSFIPHKLSVTRSGMLEVLLEFKKFESAPSPHVIPSASLTSVKAKHPEEDHGG